MKLLGPYSHPYGFRVVEVFDSTNKLVAMKTQCFICGEKGLMDIPINGWGTIIEQQRKEFESKIRENAKQFKRYQSK